MMAGIPNRLSPFNAVSLALGLAFYDRLQRRQLEEAQ